MWYKESMSAGRKNYIKASPKDGVFNYRRGIPKQYRSYFRKPDGSLRGAEWKESLKTSSKSTALHLAARVNTNYEHTLMLAKSEHESKADASKQDKLRQFLDYIKDKGIHPEQAPSVLAPEKEQREYHDKLEDVLGYMYNDFENDYLFDISYEDPLDPTYKPNDNYYLLEDQIKFLKGKGDANIKSRLRPTLGSATEEYIEDKITRDPDNADSKTRAKLNRVRRVTEDFASFIGSGSVSKGMDVYLDQIEKRQARNWMNNLIDNKTKAPSSVGREMSFLSAIYLLAVSEHSRESPELRSDYNPFGQLRGKAEDQHSEQIRLGERQDLSSRPWTPEELNAFVDRFNQMNDQARLVSMICIHTGARLKDAAGLRGDELVLNTDDDSYLTYKNNRNRKISKESIERTVPLFGDLLAELKSYVSNLGQGEDNLFPSYCDDRKRASDHLSSLLNTKHLDKITRDPRFKMHGLRDTLSSKFMATNVPNNISGYLIGWRDKTTVGMQSEYQRGGYPHKKMLDALKAAHSLKSWGTV